MPAEPFPKLLRRLRREAHLTQEELAEKAGYSPDYISMLERGLRVPPPLTTEILAKALGVAPAMLAGAPHAAEQPRATAGAREPLFGRDADATRVLDTLSRARFVTLTGPGGVGKSSLARVVAEAAAARYRDGFVVIDLTPVAPTDLLAAIGAAVGSAGSRADEPAAVRGATTDAGELIATLRDRELLLVLDGCERFVAYAEQIGALTAARSRLTDQLGALIAACPTLTILTTSRVPIRVRAEHEIAVTPLPVASDGASLEELLASPGVALFIARARAVMPELRVDLDEARMIATVCSKLDGIPLAIELAAARIKHLTLAGLVRRLDRPLALLTGGPRDLPARHQRMHDTIAWSYDLLDEQDRDRLRRLSSFTGSFSLDAAEIVCDDLNILDGISRLIDASLVVVDRDAAEPRYRMLDTIREFAAERLAETPAQIAVLSRHADYFTRFAEAAEPGLRGLEQAAWYARVSLDQGNVRSALDHLLTVGDAGRAMRLAGAIWLFWQSHGDYELGRMIEQAIARGKDEPYGIRAKALFGAAFLALRRGDLPRALELHRELLAQATAAGDDVMARNAITVAAFVEVATGSSASAIALFERCVELCRPLGPSWPLAMSLLNLGFAHLHARDLVAARRWLSDARAMHAAIGDVIFGARATAYLGMTSLLEGDLVAAEALFEASGRAFSSTTDSAGIAEGLAGLAVLRAVQGRHTDAAQLVGAFEAVSARTGWRPMMGDRALWSHYFELSRAALGDAAWAEALATGRRSRP